MLIFILVWFNGGVSGKSYFLKKKKNSVCSKVIFGEDVAFGGVFRCTVGLRDKYGEYFSLIVI